ncbi:MAG: 5-formyltetrahydrofolate cyclo-ligase [Bdellovibrionales bacterium]
MREEKAQLRSLYRQKIKNIRPVDFKNKTSQILENLSCLDVWNQSSTVAAYQALQDEISLESFCQSHHQNRFVFPVIREDQIEFYHPKQQDSFQKNSLSLLEPIPEKSKKIPVEEIDIFLVPGRVFDRQGGRLGRGRAYYDKALPASSLKIGLAFQEQIYNKHLPLESHDVMMDIIITDLFVLIPQIKAGKVLDQETIRYG